MNYDGDRFAIWSTMQARAGLEDEARAFLCEAAFRLRGEPGCSEFYAIDLGGGAFAIMNVLADEGAVSDHVGGEVARWVMGERERLFVSDYAITKGHIFMTRTAAGQNRPTTPDAA